MLGPLAREKDDDRIGLTWLASGRRRRDPTGPSFGSLFAWPPCRPLPAGWLQFSAFAKFFPNLASMNRGKRSRLASLCQSGKNSKGSGLASRKEKTRKLYQQTRWAAWLLTIVSLTGSSSVLNVSAALIFDGYPFSARKPPAPAAPAPAPYFYSS